MTHPSSTPGLIKWLGYLALVALVLLPLAVIIVRAGSWQFGLLLYAIACFGSTLLLILTIILLLLPRFEPWRTSIMQRGLLMIPGTLLLFSLVSGGNHPRIHDVTTDTADPPLFTMALQQRNADDNTLAIEQDVIAQQLSGYPDLKTLDTPLAPDVAYQRALQVATALGWQIYHQDEATGVIEAVDTTAIMAFKDDVAIRVRDGARGTQIDLRSASRVGEGDLGANAKRIRAFMDAFQQQG
jgi:uncharacterized protein (DUF1499 family)